MQNKIICGIQQVGIGVENVEQSWKWYRDNLGFDVKVFGDVGVAERMLPYTGGKPQPRYAILVLNLTGGGGFEVWEPRERKLNYPENEFLLGDFGISVCKVKSSDVDGAYTMLKSRGVDMVTPVGVSSCGLKHFYIRDPWNNLFEIEEDSYIFLKEKKSTGGVNGVVLGVSDMDKSIGYYGKLLGYDIVKSDVTGVFEDWKGLPGSEGSFRRVVLESSAPLQGPLCEVLGTSHIELVQALDRVPLKIYEGRLWGDPGFIHLCFDIKGMEAVRTDAKALGYDFVCDSGVDFDMGEANGHFTYVEDPDGTLIEFVETFKFPLIKKLGISISLSHRDPVKPLPRLITKALRFLK